MSFLPSDFKLPASSSENYFKLLEGENRIRILSSPIFGWEDWDTNNKPVRFKMENRPARSIIPEKTIRYFWAFIIFDYASEKIKIFQATQMSIIKPLESLCRDSDWGAPFNYDIKITKTGSGKDTEYTVNPVPHKPVDPYIIGQFKEKPCNLQALFMNADPFSTEWAEYTPLGVEAANGVPASVNYITSAQAEELEELVKGCDPVKIESIREFLTASCENTYDIHKMHASKYEKMREIVLDRHTKYQQSINEEMPF